MKKIICLFVSVLLFFSAAPFHIAFAQMLQENDFLLGDVTADGDIGAEDARLALRAAVKLEQFIAGSWEFLAADINGDGMIDEEDARNIMRAAVGLEDSLGSQLNDSDPSNGSIEGKNPEVIFTVGEYSDDRAPVSMVFSDCVGMTSCHINFSYDSEKITKIKQTKGIDLQKSLDSYNTQVVSLNNTINPAEYGCFFLYDLWSSENWAEKEELVEQVNGEYYESDIFTFYGDEDAVVTASVTIRFGKKTIESTKSFCIGENKKVIKPGDVDGDGFITASDSRLALRMAVGLEYFASDSPEYLAANVFADDGVTAADARWILRASIRLETDEPGTKESHQEKDARLYYLLSGTENPKLTVYLENVSDLTYFDLEIKCPDGVTGVETMKIPQSTTELFQQNNKSWYYNAAGNFYPSENGDSPYILFSGFFSDSINSENMIKLAEFKLNSSDADCELICRMKDCNIVEFQGDEQTVRHIHVPGKPTIKDKVDATCSAEGQYRETVVCTECGAILTDEVKTVPINEDAHAYGEWTTGDEENHRKICGNNPEHILSEAHSWNKGFVRSQATFTEYGEKVYTCTVCGAEKSEQIDKLPPLVATDNSTNISVTYIDVSYSAEINVITDNIEKPEEKVALLKKTYSMTVAVDISTQIKGKEVQPTTPVTVQIPLPPGFHSDTTEVYHLDQEDNATKMEITIADGMIRFDTPGFSRFVVVDTSSEVPFELGKVDSDKQVSASDARLALRASVGLEDYKPFSREFSAADIDNDGTISASDARIILRASVGLENLEN